MTSIRLVPSVWQKLQAEAEASTSYRGVADNIRHAAHYSDGSVHLTPTTDFRDLVQWVLFRLEHHAASRAEALNPPPAKRQLTARMRKLAAELGVEAL